MFTLRDFCAADAAQVDALGLAAFEQYRAAYADWPAFRRVQYEIYGRH